MQLFLSLVFLLAALTVAGCGSEPQAAGAPAETTETARRIVRVETIVLQPTSFEEVIALTGTVEALGDATLSAQAAGTVVSLQPLGATVRAGQTVALLDSGTARATVQQAEAQVAAAQANFDLAADLLKRQEPLYRDSVISALEFERVRAQHNQAVAGLAQARAALAQARQLMANTQIKAPWSGTVEAHFVERGEQVMPGAAVARVVNTSRVQVTAGVPERYAGDIRLGTPVQVTFKAYRGRPHQGRVTFVGRAIDPQSRTFPIEVELDNADGLLKPQMVADVSVARTRLDDVLVVPRSAIVHDETGTNVFVVRRTGTTAVAERVPVTTGPAYGGSIVVAGVSPGDEVVVNGQSNLTRGEHVEVLRRHDDLPASDVPASDHASSN